MAKYIDAGKQQIMNRIIKPSWEKTFCLFAIILSILAYKETCAEMKEKHPELPKTVCVWQIFGSPKLVDASNIFDYMNGAGELYLAYRFKKLAVYEYKAVDRENILAEIYFMETPDDAFGLLSQDWDGEPVTLNSSRPPVTQALRAPTGRALYGAGLLRMAVGSIYARIITYVETPESREAVLDIGRTIVPDEKNLAEPRLLQSLPHELLKTRQLQRNRIRYFRSNMVLNSFYYLSFENIFNLDITSEAVTATYANKSKGKETSLIRVLLVKYADAQKAMRGMERFRKTYLPEQNTGQPRFFQVEDGWLGYELRNEFLALVFQCPDKKTAQAVLTSIHYPKPTKPGGDHAK